MSALLIGLGSWAVIAAVFVVVWLLVRTLDDGLGDFIGTDDSDSESAIDRCVTCRGRVLPENTYLGMCEDCLYDSGTYVPSDEEWASIMRAIDDENHEGRDHR